MTVDTFLSTIKFNFYFLFESEQFYVELSSFSRYSTWNAPVLSLPLTFLPPNSQLKELDCSNYLEVRPHLTRFNNDKDMMENVAMNMDSEEDAITSLPGVQTRFGRPNWFKDFVAIGQENEG